MSDVYVIDIDVIEDHDMDDIYGHVYVSGLMGDDGTSRKLIPATGAGSAGVYTLPTVAGDAATGRDVHVPSFTSNHWRNLARRIARHYKLSGPVRISYETRETVTTFDVAYGED